MKKIFFVVLSLSLLLCFSKVMGHFSSDKINAISANALTSISNAETASSEDWKIILDDKKESNEFSFIQKNLASLGSDNGSILLTMGIIFIILSLFGIGFFSYKLYKLSKLKKNFCKGVLKSR